MTAAVGFVIGFRQIGLCLRQLRLRIQFSNVKRRLVDDKKDIAFVHKLVIFYIEFANAA